MRVRILSIVLVILTGLMINVNVTLAQTPRLVSIDYFSIDNIHSDRFAGRCDFELPTTPGGPPTLVVRISLGVTIEDLNGPLTTIVGHMRLVDPSNTLLIDRDLDILIVSPYGNIVTSDLEILPLQYLPSRPWTLTINANDGGELLRRVIDPADYYPACSYLPYEGTQQIADSFTQDNLAIFVSNDEGNPALDVYGVNEEGEGYYLFSITEDLFAPYIDNPPSENTELESVGDVTLYILTTGEYQLNIGPDEEGKVRVIIFEGLPPTNIYSYDFNVYDILNGE